MNIKQKVGKISFVDHCHECVIDLYEHPEIVDEIDNLYREEISKEIQTEKIQRLEANMENKEDGGLHFRYLTYDVREMGDKINELIEAVNKLNEKSK